MCAIFGILCHPEASALAAIGLHALQHRGQEAAGMLSFDGKEFHLKRYAGLVGDRLNSPKALRALSGFASIGHTRYSTAGGSTKCNMQPLYAELACGRIGIVHNGNLTNANRLRARLQAEGAIFSSTTDTEVILHLIARSKAGSMRERIEDALSHVVGAYSLLILTEDGMYAIRDQYAVRPLLYGMMGDISVFASESVAFDMIGASYHRDIAPGEILFVGYDGFKMTRGEVGTWKACMFEYVYFSRPDSLMSHPIHPAVSAADVRRRMGEELAREHPCPDADITVPVLDSGLFAALGYATESGILFEPALIRNHYVGRTFIEPEEGIRHLGVRLKHNANRLAVKDRRVVLIDDSLVRGTTSTKIVAMVREAGAREVHVRISCPPTKHSCFHGIDTPEKEKLLASSRDIDQMCALIGANSLAYLSLSGMYRAVTGREKAELWGGFCDACWTGEYPTPIPDRVH